MDLNSTLDASLTASQGYEMTIYGCPVSSSYILPFSPKKFEKIEEKYEIIEKIYENPLSATEMYLAIDENKTPYAIKEIKKSKLRDRLLHELAKSELSIHYSLSKKSNNIVNVYDYYETESSYYMIMEYCPNPTYFRYQLENKLKPIDNQTYLKSYCLNILSALSEIHRNNVIHGDIKPDNFLLFNTDESSTYYENRDNQSDIEDEEEDYDRIIKLTDFGLSHIISNGNTKTYMKHPLGTYGYIAPEVKSDCFIDQSIDMWSFGVTLYQMAVAYKPTSIKKYKYGSGPIPFVTSHWNRFDFVNLRNLIESCLKINPEERIKAEEALNHPWFDL